MRERSPLIGFALRALRRRLLWLPSDVGCASQLPRCLCVVDAAPVVAERMELRALGDIVEEVRQLPVGAVLADQGIDPILPAPAATVAPELQHAGCAADIAECEGGGPQRAWRESIGHLGMVTASLWQINCKYGGRAAELSFAGLRAAI